MIQPPWRRRIRSAIRQWVSRDRVLPDFIIIGAQKCGTTSLLHYLNQHPQVVPAAVKEVHFFDMLHAHGTDFYQSFFPTRATMGRRRQQLGKPVVTGEATPCYLMHPHAARRMAEVVPNAKLIALLRDPVRRAYSHYQHNCRPKHRRANREPLAFADALAQENQRTASELVRMKEDDTYESFAYRHYSYVQRGLYADQLQRFYDYFDRKQILIVGSEDLFKQTQACYADVLRFLGLEPYHVNTQRVRNSGKYASQPDAVLDELRSQFRPHNQRLYELLGRDLGWR